MTEIVESPNAPRPADPLIVHVADTLRRIEARYDREGSGPGSRFEGRLREDVQAETVVRLVREACAQLAEQHNAQISTVDWFELGKTLAGVQIDYMRPFAEVLRAQDAR